MIVNQSVSLHTMSSSFHHVGMEGNVGYVKWVSNNDTGLGIDVTSRKRVDVNKKYDTE